MPPTYGYEHPPDAETDEPLASEAEETGERALLPLEIRIEPRPPLPLGARIAIFILGWLLILIGVAGLVLPGIQGVFTIVLGAALLSIDNELVYRGLRKVFTRWPHLWHKVEHFREKAHDRMHRWFHRK